MSQWFVFGAILGTLGVLAGAFGAHGLRTRVDASLLTVFETGARYHLLHSLALLAVGLAERGQRTRWFSGAGWLFTIGTLIFSGTLYLLALTGERWLGAITPLGGVALVAGWLALAIGAVRARS